MRAVQCEDSELSATTGGESTACEMHLSQPYQASELISGIQELKEKGGSPRGLMSLFI